MVTLYTSINNKVQNIPAEIQSLTQDVSAEIQSLTQDIEVDFESGILNIFSPTAKVERLQNGNYLITITDKKGTTTAEIPSFSDESLNTIITQYLQNNPIVESLITAHNQSNVAHQDIRNLIISAIENINIPHNISELINDQKYIKNFKELLRPYNSYFEFPNIPPQSQKDMIFLDKSTGDMYVFGLNNSLTYSSIGIASNDVIYGGNSMS